MTTLTAEIDATHRVDGTDTEHPEGSYLRIRIAPKGLQPLRFIVSRGMAECLRDELSSLLRKPSPPLSAEER